jgi:hypothetical protein
MKKATSDEPSGLCAQPNDKNEHKADDAATGEKQTTPGHVAVDDRVGI